MNAPDPNPLSGRWLLALVFSVAASLIFLESVLFHALLFLATYIEATMAIPVALLGLAAGGLFAAELQRRGWVGPQVLCALVLGLVLSFPLVFASIAYLASNILIFPVVLVLPFAFGSAVLSLFFTHARSSQVYFSDLVGAGIGAALAAPALEYAGTESPFFIVAAAMSVVGLVLAWKTVESPARWLGVFGTLAALFVGVVGYNGVTDNLNLAYIAVPQGNSGGRVYAKVGSEGRELLFTHSSLSGRTDMIGKRNDKGEIISAAVFHDGLVSDSIKFKRTLQGYSLDPRAPWGLIDEPISLIIGTSAEGVVAATAGMGGEVHGIEIATGKAAAMIVGPGKELSGDHYQYLDSLEIMDARTYLRLTDRKFDNITMMNAHLGQRINRASAPEYLHTVDGIVQQLEHLTDRGFLNIEEVAHRNALDDVANVKLTLTLMAALQRDGATDPGAHVYCFRWGDYVQWLVKKTPWTEPELDWLDNWVEQQVHNRKKRPFIIIPSLIHSPRRAVHGPISAALRTGDSHVTGYKLQPSTDDRPFGFDVLPGRPVLTEVFTRIVGMALFLVILPTALMVRRELKVSPADGTLLFAYFGGLGLAYLLVEMLLIQQLQRYVGTPAASVVAILGGMLVFSGLGSLFSERAQGHSRAGVFAIVAVLGAAMAFGLEPLLDLIPLSSLWARMAVATASIAPLAFFMGMPFPMALELAKDWTGKQAGAVLFAVNGAFSALATPISVMISMEWGFRVTMFVGIALYLGCMLLFVLLERRAGGAP